MEHGSFHAAYSGPNSLSNHPEHDVSLTTTLFFIWRLTENTQFVFDPEIAGGRGFSGVTGLANANNGELPRIASATPKPYIARLYISHNFGFGSAKESFESEADQLAGSRPMTRYTIVAGRFTVTDFFDQNAYSHDPRSQFMGWGVMFNGAWDYPADTRGYTWGWMHEFHGRTGRCAMPALRNLRLPTVCVSTGVFSATAAICSREKFVISRFASRRGSFAQLSEPHEFGKLRQSSPACGRNEYHSGYQ